MNFHIVTIFPEAFESYLNSSILKRAIDRGIIKVEFYNPRDFSNNKWRRVDDRPYGGGPGMVMSAESILKTVESVKLKLGHSVSKLAHRSVLCKTIIFSAQGKRFSNLGARSFSKKYTDIILICGHYEGIDARVKKILRAEEISIGPYILTGGELPAMVLMDSVSRQVRGVLGKEESLEDDRVASPEVYTRPEVLAYKGKLYRVPKVFLSGHHAKIEEYKNSLRAKRGI
ncbi:MAG: tRNA (guanosine(37)-N1)-methyltransferase TrmD [Candidatus Vogelbacteria bacterium]|nr:tRNA (guanosine(37)-N1)-methyltransferase TrmD [Candidatus Vogelbacteria bacterium]